MDLIYLISIVKKSTSKLSQLKQEMVGVTTIAITLSKIHDKY